MQDLLSKKIFNDILPECDFYNKYLKIFTL